VAGVKELGFSLVWSVVSLVGYPWLHCRCFIHVFTGRFCLSHVFVKIHALVVTSYRSGAMGLICTPNFLMMITPTAPFYPPIRLVVRVLHTLVITPTPAPEDAFHGLYD